MQGVQSTVVIEILSEILCAENCYVLRTVMCMPHQTL